VRYSEGAAKRVNALACWRSCLAGSGKMRRRWARRGGYAHHRWPLYLLHNLPLLAPNLQFSRKLSPSRLSPNNAVRTIPASSHPPAFPRIMRFGPYGLSLAPSGHAPPHTGQAGPASALIKCPRNMWRLETGYNLDLYGII
jgi:hypothetical protein